MLRINRSQNVVQNNNGIIRLVRFCQCQKNAEAERIKMGFAIHGLRRDFLFGMEITVKVQRPKIIRVKRQFDAPDAFFGVQLVIKRFNFARNTLQNFFDECFASWSENSGSCFHFRQQRSG
jgi:hypothetical protein